jgi:UDP-glucose 4-epimerase
MSSTLLITGGAGFIGSHTCLVLLNAGYDVVVLDNFSNSSPEALSRVAELAGLSQENHRLMVVEGDVRCLTDLDTAFKTTTSQGAIKAVIHFAGLKAVGDSVAEPLSYWDVNVVGSQKLLTTMQAHGVRTIAFSSSATLYGYPTEVPISENAQIQPINPYGSTKAAAEQILADVFASEPGWRIARLRYFNPVGAHPSGKIGEDPSGIPNNLFPYLTQVAIGRRQELNVFGGDWPTKDGTGVRDYIHVMDLAEGHCAALQHLMSHEPQLLTLNLGSGHGHSVLEVIAAFEVVSHQSIPYTIVDRRAGDAAITVADPRQARSILNWHTKRPLEEICKDGWRWQRSNPRGYRNEI